MFFFFWRTPPAHWQTPKCRLRAQRISPLDRFNVLEPPPRRGNKHCGSNGETARKIVARSRPRPGDARVISLLLLLLLLSCVYMYTYLSLYIYIYIYIYLYTYIYVKTRLIPHDTAATIGEDARTSFSQSLLSLLLFIIIVVFITTTTTTTTTTTNYY